MNRISRWVNEIPDAHIDCTLFALIAFFIFAQGYCGGDEAAKFLSPQVKFWVNFVLGSGGAVCGSVKMFRSTAYAQHKEKKDAESNTQIIRRLNEPGPVP